MDMFQHGIQPCLGAATLMGLLNNPGAGVFDYPCLRSDIRRFVRITGFFHVELWVDGRRYSSITHNISYGGMFIETGQQLSDGQQVSLCVQLSPDAGQFHVDGEIIRNSPHGIGVKLLRD
ncbi:MAG: PilZ domain-containing protein [Proteobacteria bacterium]|nr:PilZ domain-containing protein [Pseudomonadota bacterium]